MIQGGKMFLTPSEMRRLDMADVHAICESMPAYKYLSQAVKTEYYLAMMHAIEGQEINPFQELTLSEGVLIWKERKLMDEKITKWLSPDLITQTFTRMRDIIARGQKVQVRLAEIKVSIEDAKAKMAANPDFKWGKNDTERDSQLANAFPALVKTQNDVKMEWQKIQDEGELVRIDLTEIQTLIDFFKVFEHVSGE